MTTKLLIAAGVTSNLFAALWPKLRFSVNQIYAFARTTTDPVKLKYQNVLRSQFLIQIYDEKEGTTLQEQLQAFFNTHHNNDEWRILWLSTHDDAASLEICGRFAPTLAIGSGAMIDYYTGLIPEANAYINGKIRMALTPNVTVLCFGFLIEDDLSTLLHNTGLHLGTTKVLTNHDTDPDFKWNKAYYLTPKSFACEAIIRWMANPSGKLNKWYHVGSTRPYKRGRIAMIMNMPVPDTANTCESQKVYARFANDFAKDFGISCNDENMILAILRLKKWSQLHFENENEPQFQLA